MAQISIETVFPAGAELFADREGFLTDLAAESSEEIYGGVYYNPFENPVNKLFTTLINYTVVVR